MVHDVFINGFRDDIIMLKSKIRKKMLDLGYMQEDYNFLSGFHDFWLCYDQYNILNIDKKEIINVIYTTNKNPNPIVYLTLIIFLFGTLKSYYEYEVDEQSIKLIYQKPTRVMALTQQQKPCGLIYYKDLIRDIYKERYSILRKANRKLYEIKCNECNHIWIIPQYYIRSKLVNCPNCKKRSSI
jgi:ribosomal protein S27E